MIVGLDTCDEIAPTFDVLRVTPNVLFPPDQSYVDVSAVVEVSDDFDDSSAVRLVQVRSNEPDNGEEDGNTGQRPADVTVTVPLSGI